MIPYQEINQLKILEGLAKTLFRGHNVFITGVGSGINLGIARNFAALGANLAICSRDIQKLEKAADEQRAIGAKVLPVCADVRDAQAVTSALASFVTGTVVVVDGGHYLEGPALLNAAKRSLSAKVV